MSFSTEKALQKFSLLNNTQQSIQTTSQWCLFHYRHAQDIVSLWKSSFIAPSSTIDQSDCNYRLALFYLCNDIIQFAKKKEEKYNIFLVEFKKIMPDIMNNISNDSTNIHFKDKYARVLSVWKDRSIYSPDVISQLERLLNKSASSVSSATTNNHQLEPKINNTSMHIEQNITHPNDFVPVELQQIITKYNRLNQLHKSYKTNFSNFNKVSDSVLNDNDSTNILKQEEKSQLNNILSSLSALQKLTPTDSNISQNRNQNTDHIDANDDQDLKIIENLENLATEIENQSYEITNLRTEISRDLSKLSSELDDWISLDKNKQLKLKCTLKNIRDRKKSIIDERNKISVFNYSADNDNDEIIPKYDDDAGNSSDSDGNIANNSEDDSDDSGDSDGDQEGDREEQEESLETPKHISALQKRLLGDSDNTPIPTDGDAEYEESKRKRAKKNASGNGKSVTFAEEPETHVFDKNESINSSSATPPFTEVDSDEALQNILGLLQ